MSSEMDNIKVVTWSDVVSKQKTSEVSKPITAISHKINENINVTDAVHINSTTLACYHYNESCNIQSQDELKQYRGIIYETARNKIICKTFGYTDSYNMDDPRIEDILKLKPSIYDSKEGFHIRVFNYDSTWFISTHKNINAYNSKWASTSSYGDIFDRAVGSLFDNEELSDDMDDKTPIFNRRRCESKHTRKLLAMLNSDYVYDFMVGNDSMNRLVCRPTNPPFVYLVGIFTREGDYITDSNTYKIPVPTPKKLELNTPTEISKYISKLDYMEYQGLMLITDTGKLIKIFHPHYQHYMNIRGSSPSMVLRYLEIRKDESMVDDLLFIFPEFEEQVIELKKLITELLPNSLLNIHNIRYKRHEYYHTDKIVHFILRNLHSSGVSNITPDMIKNEIDRLSPNALYKVVRNFQYERESI